MGILLNISFAYRSSRLAPVGLITYRLPSPIGNKLLPLTRESWGVRGLSLLRFYSPLIPIKYEIFNGNFL